MEGDSSFRGFLVRLQLLKNLACLLGNSTWRSMKSTSLCNKMHRMLRVALRWIIFPQPRGLLCVMSYTLICVSKCEDIKREEGRKEEIESNGLRHILILMLFPEKKKNKTKKTKGKCEKLEASSPRGAGREAAPARADGGREHEMWRGIF